jgi:outer membrane protein assembly factor BamB
MALFLALTIAATAVALPTANAHTPAWTIPTWCYITATPNPVGVNQQASLVFWVDKVPPTAMGEYGDRWTFNVEVTKPDKTSETLGPFTSDPIGSGYSSYTPTQTGTYTFVAKFLGKVLNTPPPASVGYSSASSGAEYINDTYAASSSDPAELIVQQEPIQYVPSVPLPTDYWTRPINAANRAWAEIAGNWLGGAQPVVGLTNSYAANSTAPDSAHIVWTKPVQFGGIAGVSDVSYYTGSAYESMWNPPIIIGGRLYYDEPTSPREGWYCVDLRTGETIWYQNATGPIQIGSQTPAHIGGTNIPWMYARLSFGQVLDYESPNQHGAVAYVWATYYDTAGSTYTYTMLNGSTYSFTAAPGSTVWQMYDAFTGEWICNIANVPAGTMFTGADGSLLIYTYDAAHGWLTLWNSSQALAYPNNNLQALTLPGGEATYWMWRPPIGETVDGNNGYMWNVTAPKDPMAAIGAALDDRLICTSGLTAFRYGTNAYSVYALSLKPGQEGIVMWRQNYTAPPVVNATIVQGPSSQEDGVYTMMIKETMQWYGYSIDTGEKLWGPTTSQASMDMYSMRSAGAGRIAYGKLFSAGYAGILYCYDIKTGTLLWNSSLGASGLEAVYANWPVGSGAGITIADHKIYVTTNEHSVTQPIYRTWGIYCFDTETGKNLWNITALMPALAIADGYAVALNGMDNQIYCFGKGPSATTVSAPEATQPLGTPVVIKGTVTDESPGAKGTPAISDADQEAWMEYLYQQTTIPANAKGVEVSLDTLDPNGNFVHIGTATSDMSGTFSYTWTPDVPGKYTVIATFAGSASYGSSYAETAVGVSEAPATTPPTQTTVQESPMLTYVLAAVIALIIVVLASVILLLRRK